MLTTERQEFRKTLERLGRVFSRQITEELLDDYWIALRDLPLAAFQRRATWCTQHGKYFPRPRELLDNPDNDRRNADTYNAPPPEVDDWEATLNRVMMRVVLGRIQHGQRMEASALPAMIEWKRHVAAQMREAHATREDWADLLPSVTSELHRRAGL